MQEFILSRAGAVPLRFTGDLVKEARSVSKKLNAKTHTMRRIYKTTGGVLIGEELQGIGDNGLPTRRRAMVLKTPKDARELFGQTASAVELLSQFPELQEYENVP